MKRRRPLLYVFAGCGCVVAALAIAAFWPYLFREPVGVPTRALPPSVEGPNRAQLEPQDWYAFGRNFVGHTAASITDNFGPPSSVWGGHYGLPPLDFRRTYPEAVTWVYERPLGTLYLSFCRQRGQWVCFCADWLTEGMVF